MKIMQLIVPALTSWRHTSKESWETDTGPKWLQPTQILGNFKTFVSSNPKAAMAFPRRGCQKWALALLRDHIPFSAPALKTDEPGICFPWEGSWHKCHAGLPAAFGVSQGEVISVNHDLNLQHQYSVIVKWLNETPQAIAGGRMRMRGRSLGGSQQGDKHSTLPDWEGLCSRAPQMDTHTLSRDSSTVGKVGLHVLMSLTRPGQGQQLLQQGRISRGIEHTKIIQLWIKPINKSQQEEMPRGNLQSYYTCLSPPSLVVTCSGYLSLKPTQVASEGKNLLLQDSRVPLSWWGKYSAGAGGMRTSLWQLKFPSALCLVRAGMIYLLMPCSRSASLLECSHYTRKSPSSFLDQLCSWQEGEMSS